MGQHWYSALGEPQHTVVGKNGKERPTTLRDARKLNLFPSVTTILSVQDKPMLTQWLINQLLDAVILEPYNPHEWEIDKWRSFAMSKMREKGNKAADKGTQVHGYLEHYFKTGEYKKGSKKYCEQAIKLINETFPDKEWASEKTFAAQGFAGCCDLHCEDVIIDFKTKDVEDINIVEQYDDHKMQLAAYLVGLKLPYDTRGFNLFINVNENHAGECKLIECSEFGKYLGMFSHLHEFWQLKNNYIYGEDYATS